MMKFSKGFAAAAVAGASISGFVGSAAFAQDTIFGSDSAATEVSDLQTQIADDAERDTFTFGNAGRTVGTFGSVALRANSAQSYNGGDDIISVGIGANYGFFDGVNGSELNLSYAYGSTNGVEDKNTLNAGYDYTRDINERFYGYAALNVKYDNLALATENRRDAFLGFGAGYRILNTADTQWAVQAGPGYRFIELGDLTQTDEAAYSVESSLFQRFNDTVYLSNDTTLVGSETDVSITNELALNVAMSQTLSLRTSLVSEWGGADFNSVTATDNTYGVSVVYNFN
jgi:putative salt-induced outer membrane protein